MLLLPPADAVLLPPLAARSSAAEEACYGPLYPLCYSPEENGEPAVGLQYLPFHAQMAGAAASVGKTPSVPSSMTRCYPAACARRYSRGDIPIAWVKARVKCQGYW